MHVLVASHSLPQPSSNGGPMTVWAVMRSLLDWGHDVTVLSLAYPDDPFLTDERLGLVRDAGAEIEIAEVPFGERSAPSDEEVGGTVRRLLAPRREDLFPTATISEQVSAKAREIGADAAFIYHWDTLAALSDLTDIPRLAAVGDPWHLPHLRRWQHSPDKLSLSWLKGAPGRLRDVLHYPHEMAEMLSECGGAGCFQASFAARLRDHGADHCVYYPTPLEDAPGKNWQQLRDDAQGGDLPTVLLGPSSLGTTITSAGLRFFAEGILPHLEDRLGRAGFRVRIVGDGDPPQALSDVLPHPALEFIGRIEPADPEFLACDVQLVPTPFVLGIRVRIVAGMSFGCCVVATEDESANIPELEHGENCLLGSTGEQMAENLALALEDEELRQRLGANARRTFEETFERDTAAGRIVEDLEALAEGVPASSPSIPIER